MTGASAMSMFAALLDRSVTRIRELAADGRRFDRQAIAEIADVWDNNTFPLFSSALSRPAWLRERRARAALVWMAELGPSRRAWMIEQAAVAGHRLEPLLPPLVHPVVHYRDYRGEIQPGIEPLTATAVASVAKDYDLARAEVRTVRVERAGHELCGYVALAAPRRYTTSDKHADAVVQLFLSDVRDVRFDSGDGAGATVAADEAGVEVRVGTQGRLRATSATVDDRTSGPILRNTVGVRMDRHAATRRLRHLAHAAGLRMSRMHPHMLRHTFVTTMLDAGVSLRDVQIAARHADPRTTMRYDRARKNLDRHSNYILVAYMASGT